MAPNAPSRLAILTAAATMVPPVDSSTDGREFILVDAPKLPPLPRRWEVRCGCGVKSLAVLSTKEEAEADAIQRSGFRRVGERLYCRKCAKKVKQ